MVYSYMKIFLQKGCDCLTGKSHIATGVVTVGFVADSMFLIKNTESPVFLQTAVDNTLNYVFDNGRISFWLYVLLAVLLYILGILLPDIDHPYSMIGKIIHLPIQHRTWTHAIWLVLIFGLLSIPYRLCIFVGVGMFVHDFWDSFSRTGNRWFYPLDDEFVKKHHKLKLYYTGQSSEYIVVGILIALLLVYTFFVFQHVFQFVNISL